MEQTERAADDGAATAASVLARHVHEELAFETQRKRALLQRCGVTEEELSRHGQMYLHVLSEVAELLALKDTKSSSYLLAMTDLEDALELAEQQARAARAAATESHSRSQELQREWKQLEHVKQQLAAAADEREQHENTATILQRTAEYADKQRVYEDELSRLSEALRVLPIDAVQDRLEHHTLSALEKECAAIEEENRVLGTQLLPFHDLPLNRELAAAKLVVARTELQQLEDQFSAQIQQML